MEYTNHYRISMRKSSFIELQNVFEVLQIRCEKAQSCNFGMFFYINADFFFGPFVSKNIIEQLWMPAALHMFTYTQAYNNPNAIMLSLFHK